MNDTQKILSPHLYRALLLRFGAVKISRPGHPYSYRIICDAVTRKPKEDVVASGEYYRVNCPFCRDTKKRLLINHRYGSLCRETGRRRWFLARCLNETRCLDHYDNQVALRDYIFGHVNARDLARLDVIRQGAVASDDSVLKPVSWPGDMVDILSLPGDHEAVRWLRDRGYSVEELCAKYRIRFCCSSKKYPACAGRIIIPVFFQGEMIGWQGRLVGDPSSKRVAKYYTMPGFPKSRVLYNWDIARRANNLVVVEGVSDVWRVGLPGVAALGSSLSPNQERLIANWWETHKEVGTLIFLPDGDIWEGGGRVALERTLSRWRQRLPRVGAIRLPADRDPGSYEARQLWEIIESQLADQGISLYWPSKQERSQSS